MELKDRKSNSVLQGTKALGQALVANINPSFSQSQAPQEASVPQQTTEHVRVFSHSDLANLTLHQVAREGDVMLMEKLLERLPHTHQQKKKRLNAKDDSKLTPMHYAARYNHYHMIKFLIKNGASVTTKGEDDATPLHFIAKYKKKKSIDAANDDDESSSDEELPPEESFSCLALLVEHGAEVNTRDALGLTPLHQACTRGNTSVVRELLVCSMLRLEMMDHQGMTALHLACLYGRRTIVKALIDAGANLRCRDKDMTTPLHLACAEGGQQIAELLLDAADKPLSSHVYNNVDEHGKSNNNDGKHTSFIANNQNNGGNKVNTDSNGGTAELLQDTDGEKNLPLHLAIENGHLKLVEFCIEKAKQYGLGSMVDHVRTRDDSSLHLAVSSNTLDIVKMLRKEGADVNARNSSLVTPLLLASQHNAHGIVKYLLENGANIELKDSDFMTPLLVASRYGHLETITWLLQYRADITETDKDDRTCLMWAADEDRTEACKLLLEKNKMRMMIEERDKFNNTALHLASMKGHASTVKLLLDYRASAVIKNDDDRTTLHMAALHGHDSIIPDLVYRDRSIINSGDEESNTALHLAAIGGNLKCVSVLISLGANIEMRNAKQWTPLDCAAAFGFVKPARAILEAGASVQPRGKIKVCALHLACQRGHVDIIHLLLQWKADVTFRSADGRNALDYAIDFSQKECVLALIKHETWKSSLKNAVIHPVTGRLNTPMRKLIRKMEDMAEIVCNQCVVDNNKKPEDDDYKVTLSYEFFDDVYACTEWMERSEAAGRPSSGGKEDQVALTSEDNIYTVYDEHDQLTEDAYTYDSNSDVLQQNHPLNIMVESKCETLLLHPVVTGLLNHKWRRYGRYVYYSNLIFFTAYLVVLNAYMMLMPPFYRIDWQKMIQFREYLSYDGNVPVNGTNFTGLEPLFNSSGSECFFYRVEVLDTWPWLTGCQSLSTPLVNLRWVIFAFSIFNLLRELFQLINQRLGYFDLTNIVEVTLYILSLVLCIDFGPYPLDDIVKISGGTVDVANFTFLDGLQADTGLRQEWQQEIGAFAVFLSWMGLLLFIQKIPRLGIFVVMFTDILKTFGQFFMIFIFFILGFAFAFTILIGNQLVFENWYESLVSTTVMMIGEMDYTSKFFSGDSTGQDYRNELYTKQVSFVLFVIFLIVMTIIIMNLLVGLAVGDIIEVQEHATLERLGMTVDLALEVEFTLPAFIRKRVCLRKQILEINKYRKSNFLKRFLLEDSEMNYDHISKALDQESADNEESRSMSDRVLNGLSLLRNKISDLVVDQTEIKQGVRTVRHMVRDVKKDTKFYADDLKDNLHSTNMNISKRIDQTHTGLTQTTQLESGSTRDRVDHTQTVVASLQTELDQTNSQIAKVKAELEQRMEILHQTLLTRTWKELEDGLSRCSSMIEKSRSEIMENLEEMKIVLVKEKYMSNV